MMVHPISFYRAIILQYWCISVLYPFERIVFNLYLQSDDNRTTWWMIEFAPSHILPLQTELGQTPSTGVSTYAPLCVLYVRIIDIWNLRTIIRTYGKLVRINVSFNYTSRPVLLCRNTQYFLRCWCKVVTQF